ncbi:MAG: fumarylacetoacetate hydrolase family protein [Pseudomonadota bacterium]
MHYQPTELQCLDGSVLAVRHAWCVGRNYAAHAREMGANPEAESPLFFSKPASALVQQQQIEYPSNTQELHHEVELVVILGSGGRNVTPEQASDCIVGWAVGCDLTRRDVQAAAKKAGHPWALSKGFDQSGPVGQVVAAASWQPLAEHTIRLQVNGELRQSATLAEMIWNVPVLLSRLSQEVSLHAGDMLFSGTPAGVAALGIGDRVQAEIDGLPSLDFQIIERRTAA